MLPKLPRSVLWQIYQAYLRGPAALMRLFEQTFGQAALYGPPDPAQQQRSIDALSEDITRLKTQIQRLQEENTEGIVRYSTSDGTATAGVDYVPKSEILLFAETVTSRTFTITILDDTAFEGNETINLSLSNPSSSLTLGSPSTATLTIIDNDSPQPLNRKFDFDGDGRADVAVFRPTNGVWYFTNSSNNAFNFVQFGMNGDLITPADFDGDGRADISVFRPSNGTWYRLNSSTNQFVYEQFGITTDVPVPGDFDGNGRAEIAVFRPSNGTWYTSTNPAINYGAFVWGQNGDIPVPGDFDGDGRADLAIFRPSNGYWYMLGSTAGVTYRHFGASGDVPTPAAFGQ